MAKLAVSFTIPGHTAFGGTDPLKALVTTFGFDVTRDSFHDGYAEWVNREIEKGNDARRRAGQ